MRWIVLALATLAGCCSFRTTAVDRCENDCLVVNPHHPMHGIPVTLRVPTHLEITVTETTYWEKQENPGERSTLIPLATCRATRSVVPEVKYTEKIFLVDPVKPGAGTQSYGFTFTSSKGDRDGKDKDDGKGYLRKVEYKIDDQTIKESANLLSNALAFISAFQTGANDARQNTGTLISTDRVVAFGRFDINSANFEEQVGSFLECNVNQARCQPPICPKICTPARCN